MHRSAPNELADVSFCLLLIVGGHIDYATQNQSVEAKIEAAMKDFNYPSAGYALDTTPGRVFYFYHDCTRYWKYIRPVKKL